MIKEVIRKNLPETNSSSSHSVVISLDPTGIIGETEWDLIIDKDGNLHIPEFMSFGREFFCTNSALTKLQYLSCHYIYGPFMDRGGISKKIHKFRSVLKNILGINNIIVEEYVEFCKGINSGELDASDIPYYEYPEVDHESQDIFDEILESEETIKNFILNKNTWLYGGSDGYRAEPEVYINTETLPKNIGCLSIDFGGEIGRVDIEITETLDEETLSKQFRFLNNFKYNADTGLWEITNAFQRFISFGPEDPIIFDLGTLRYNNQSGQVDMKFELYKYDLLSI